MKAKKKQDVFVEYMEFPSRKFPPPEWFDDYLKTGVVYHLIDSYYVRTEVGTVCFPPNGYLLVRQHSGELYVMNRSEFFRLFNEVKE